MWYSYLLAVFLGGVPWPNVLTDAHLRQFLSSYDRVARQRPSLVTKVEMSQRDGSSAIARAVTITAVRPATLRIDLHRAEKAAAETMVLTDREWRMYDAERGIAARRLTNSRVPFLGIIERPTTHERVAAWVLFGHSRYVTASFRLRITKQTDWYLLVRGEPREPESDLRQMEVVFNRKQMTPARVWFLYSGGTQITWLVKEARVNKGLTAANALKDLPPVEGK